MRQPSWACSVNSLILAVVRSMVLLVAGLFVQLDAVAAQSLLRLDNADFAVSESSVLPAESPLWRSTVLPHRSDRPVGQDLTGYWYRLTFDAQDISQPLWLLFPKLRSGGSVYVNGLLVGKISEADAATQRRWFRPFMFIAPPVALRPVGNEIRVHFRIREPLTSFGEVLIGPEQSIRSMYDRLLFWENTVTEVAGILCLIVGALTMLIWVRRRHESLYGIFSACALFWGVRTLVFRMPEVTMDHWVAWRFTYYFTTAGFIVFITLFLLRLSQCVKPVIERFLVAYWFGGCAVFLAIGVAARPAMDAWWTLGFLPFNFYSVLVLLLYARRTRTPSALAMLAAIMFAFALALHDFAVQHGLFGLEEFYLLHLGIPAFLLVMALILLERFLKTLELADSMQDQLAARLADRERELLRSHERLRKLERLNAIAGERQRIMENLHDGVGAQLITSLMLVKGGRAGQSDMINLLQDCIDEMRISLDSLAMEDDDLLSMLENFRARISPRFSAIGLKLQWTDNTLPDSASIPPQCSLQILRVLQEALANILKHAQAANVLVSVGMEGESLVISVKDDGVGIDPSIAVKGHGIGNMRNRAERIGGSFAISGSDSGTTVRLSVPLSTPTQMVD